VCPTVIQQEHVEAIRKGLGKGINEELEHRGVQIRELQEEALGGGGFHGAIDVEPFEDVLD
jgi:hypothetical protein